ncbi:hypothetical protein LTS17_008715 [Exophiala oligosperma]
MSATIILVAASICSYFLYHLFVLRAKYHGFKRLPGPKGYPLIGSILDFPKAFSYHKFTEWAAVYGPIYQVNILGATHVVISDVNIANDMLALRGAHYSDRPVIVMLHDLVSGGGNLGSSPLNKYWRNARKLAAAQLSTVSLEGWGDMQIFEAARLVDDLVQDPDRYDYFFERYSSVTMLQIIYGKKVSRAEEEGHVKKIMTIVHTLERTGAPGAYLVDFLPFLRYLPKSLAGFKREAEKLHNFEYSYFHGLVTEARERYITEKPSNDGTRAVIYGYLDNEKNYDLSDFDLAYCLGTLFEGGSGTTSSTMQSFCLAMWYYPEWQKKIQQEIDEVIGDRLPTFDDFPRLPTVRAAIKETLRWRPVVPGGIPHLSTKEGSFDGFFIPKGAIIHANQYAMFKDESIYPDAESYNPERWLDPKYPTFQAPLNQYPNIKRYASFGFGRRICPGFVVAERSLFIETTMLMWACSVTKKHDDDGAVIPVPWYEYKPGVNTGPKRFQFAVKIREEKRAQMLRKACQEQY